MAARSALVTCLDSDSLSEALEAALAATPLKRYVGTATITGLTKASQDFTLSPAAPTNYVAISYYFVVSGTPTPTDPDTDSLLVSVGTDAVPGIFGGPGFEIISKTGRVGVSPTTGLGLRSAETLKLRLRARLDPDTDGDLEHIDGLDEVKFVLYYIEPTSE